MKRINHEFTNEVTCPHCGDELGDSWELRGDDGDWECGECGGLFRWSRHVEVTYSTSFVQFEPTRQSIYRAQSHQRSLDLLNARSK